MAECSQRMRYLRYQRKAPDGAFFYWKGMIVDCDTRGNIEGETKEITLRTLNKILCDTIDKALGDAGVINIRVEVLDDDHSM